MFKDSFQSYLDAAANNREICVVVYSIESGNKIATNYDVIVDINEYGELLITIAV